MTTEDWISAVAYADLILLCFSPVYITLLTDITSEDCDTATAREKKLFYVLPVVFYKH